ncbi:F0F1 ATP synthase subunit delta [Gimesia maris]|uniref:ATP synthase subunit b n=1 Tax=Gimesia maris TaxID=122 RepID=A0ABX5YK58_9PLAN|nr:F0F1 ATP synthase subunit delta [Gimesia maris]EDL61110.1 H(+)-transporting ATP synthase, subunit B [Gimesia maris DSM 8797]QEG16025.1 ATP synthase subunit b [Gimesia maris]QGQ30721.1 hypothetical protein F1729_19885 [Gimesia maris]
MSIDWFTFTAQILNFLVLVWLLSHFLYKPVLNAMAEREKKIAAEHEAATAAQNEAKSELARYQQQTEDLSHAREELLAEAGKEIQIWKEQHLAQARKEIAQEKTDWFRALHRERESFLREARLRMAAHMHQMSHRILKELADSDLQQQTISVFMNRIKQIDETHKQEFLAKLESSDPQMLVESAFELTQPERKNITDLIHDYLSREVTIRFRVNHELICGIDLHLAGYKISWNLQESLEELEEEFVRSLNDVISTDSEPGINPKA